MDSSLFSFSFLIWNKENVYIRFSANFRSKSEIFRKCLTSDSALKFSWLEKNPEWRPDSDSEQGWAGPVGMQDFLILVQPSIGVEHLYIPMGNSNRPLEHKAIVVCHPTWTNSRFVQIFPLPDLPNVCKTVGNQRKRITLVVIRVLQCTLSPIHLFVKVNRYIWITENVEIKAMQSWTIKPALHCS